MTSVVVKKFFRSYLAKSGVILSQTPFTDMTSAIVNGLIICSAVRSQFKWRWPLLLLAHTLMDITGYFSERILLLKRNQETLTYIFVMV